MNRLTLTSTAVIALFSIGAAQALPPEPPAFAWFDSDGDGRISQQEFTAGHVRRVQERAAQGYRLRHVRRRPEFANLDLDGDAGLRPEELAPAPAASWRSGPRAGGGPPCPRRGR